MIIVIWTVSHKITPLPVHPYLVSSVTRRHKNAQMFVRLSMGMYAAIA